MNLNKYNQIYQSLSSDIVEGKYEAGEILPSEHKLLESFGVSRETVRKALNLLQENGYIQKMKGKGSVIIYNPSMNLTVSHLTSFKEVQKLQEKIYDTKVYRLEKRPAKDCPPVQEALDLNDETLVWELIRQRLYEDKTHIIDTDYFMYDMMPGLNEEIAGGSIYEYIEERLGHKISYSQKEITFSPMTELDIELFGPIQPPYTANVKSVVHLKDATPFQYNVSKHLASEFKFVDFSRRFTGE